jgi:predicted nucleotidyltransferase component of viral defense system
MTKNIAHSLKAKLLNLCDHDNKRYQQLLVHYMQERFLYRLSKSDYNEHFILKGGALLYAYTEFLPRPTIDVDFMGARISNDKQSIINAFKEIADTEVEDDGVRFVASSISSSDIAVERKYPGVRIAIVAFLDTIRKELTFDIGFGDVITPRPVIMQYPVIFNEMSNPQIVAYSLETVVAEKFQTMIDKGEFNSRMKDFFDLYRIIIAHEFNEEDLKEAIRTTFHNRNTDFTPNHIVFSEDFASSTVLNLRWNAFCAKLKIAPAPTFAEVMKTIVNFIMPYWENLQETDMIV